MLKKLIRYENSINRISEDKVAIEFVKSNIEKINLKTLVYRHGD